MLRASVLLLLALSSVSCVTVSMLKSHKVGVEKTQRNHFFLWGLVGEEQIEVNKMCRNKVIGVREYFSPGDSFFSIVTLGIWSPRSFTVTCEQ